MEATRRLQLMRYRVDKRIVLLVAADFADQKNGVEHHARDDHQHQHRTQEQQNASDAS